MTSLFEWTPAETLPAGLIGTRRPVSLLEFGPVAVAETADTEPPVRDEAEERAQQVRTMVDAAREAAVRETREACRLEMEVAVEQERARVRALEAEFARAQVRYFAEAEGQVLALALAIARKVLGRETEADGTHLKAIVRAALGRVQDGSASVLRVPVGAGEAWRAVMGDSAVLEDDRVQAGEVKLETSIGVVELGVRVGMEEIERGFGTR